MLNDESYTISYKENASPTEEETLIQGIKEEAKKAGLSKMITPFSFFIKDASQTILAGVKGSTYYGCLYIDSLWVAEKFRNKKWGSLLMQESEKLGKEKNCTFATLTTMSWEALPFYQKIGYEIEYMREGFEKGSKMFVLRKTLN